MLSVSPKKSVAWYIKLSFHVKKIFPKRASGGKLLWNVRDELDKSSPPKAIPRLDKTV